MKKFLFILSLLISSAFAQTTTPNLGLTLPPHGAPNWDTAMNGNFNILDASAGTTKTVTNYGLKCDNITDDTSAFQALLSTIGSTPTRLLFPSSRCRLGSISTPATATLDFSSGGAISAISSTTPPGGAAFVQGNGTANPAASPTSSCSVTLPNTGAGDAIIFLMMQYDDFATKNLTTGTPTDGANFYNQVQVSTYNFPGYILSWVASNVKGGTVTITAPITGSTKNACIAQEYSGLGQVV